ncbi:MAG TPA: hypothetical protein PLG41_16480 [Leptospiraceae bacterium]|nr:hypothetical protein [Leptospiraceae bacterium]
MRFILYNKSFYAKYSIVSASTYFFSDGDKLLHINYTVIKYSFFVLPKPNPVKTMKKILVLIIMEYRIWKLKFKLLYS